MSYAASSSSSSTPPRTVSGFEPAPLVIKEKDFGNKFQIKLTEDSRGMKTLFVFKNSFFWSLHRGLSLVGHKIVKWHQKYGPIQQIVGDDSSFWVVELVRKHLKENHLNEFLSSKSLIAKIEGQSLIAAPSCRHSRKRHSSSSSSSSSSNISFYRTNSSYESQDPQKGNRFQAQIKDFLNQKADLCERTVNNIVAKKRTDAEDTYNAKIAAADQKRKNAQQSVDDAVLNNNNTQIDKDNEIEVERSRCLEVIRQGDEKIEQNNETLRGLHQNLQNRGNNPHPLDEKLSKDSEVYYIDNNVQKIRVDKLPFVSIDQDLPVYVGAIPLDQPLGESKSFLREFTFFLPYRVLRTLNTKLFSEPELWKDSPNRVFVVREYIESEGDWTYIYFRGRDVPTLIEMRKSAVENYDILGGDYRSAKIQLRILPAPKEGESSQPVTSPELQAALNNQTSENNAASAMETAALDELNQTNLEIDAFIKAGNERAEQIRRFHEIFAEAVSKGARVPWDKLGEVSEVLDSERRLQILSYNASVDRAEFGEDHRLWKQALSDLEDIMRVCKWTKGEHAAHFAVLANDLVYNARLLAGQYEQFNKQKKFLTAVSEVGLSIKTFGPFMGVVASLVKMGALFFGGQPSKERRLLSEKDFFSALENGLMPMVQRVHLSLSQGQLLLRDQMEAFASAQTKALGEIYLSLSAQLEEHTSGLHHRFDKSSFDQFVSDNSEAISKYNKKVRAVNQYCQGKQELSPKELKEYLDNSIDFLHDRSTNIRRGFNNQTALFPLEVASTNILYGTGLLHAEIHNSLRYPLFVSFMAVAVPFVAMIQKKFMTRENFSVENTPQVVELANRLCEIADGHQSLFNQTSRTLHDVINSYHSMIEKLRKRREDNFFDMEACLLDKAAESAQAELDQLDRTFVGSSMYYLSHLVSKVVGGPEFAGKITNENDFSFVIQALNPFYSAYLLWGNDSKGIQEWNSQIYRVISVIKTSSPHALLTQSYQLPKTEALQKSSFKDYTFTQTVSSDAKGEFISEVAFSQIGKIPVVGIVRPTITSIGGGARSEAKPLIAFKAIYTPENNMVITKPEANSILSQRDIARIPSSPTIGIVEVEAGYRRREFLREMLELMKEKRTIEKVVPCLSADGKGSPIYMSRIQMEYLIRTYCPISETILLAGDKIHTKYQFDKGGDGFYHLKIEIAHGNGLETLPFISPVIFKASHAAVESYRKHGPSGAIDKEANRNEFLHMALFGDQVEGEGLPGVGTFVEETKGLTAPTAVPFPGIIAIGSKFPEYQFVFDHSRYTEEVYRDLIGALQTGMIPQSLSLVFREIEANADLENYIEVQKKINASLKKLQGEFGDFNKKLQLFKMLVALSSNLDENQINRLLVEQLGILPIDQLGGIENVHYFEPPMSDAISQVLDQIERNPSKEANDLVDIQKHLKSFLKIAPAVNTATDDVRVYY